MNAKARTLLFISATAALSVFGTNWWHSVRNAREAALRPYEDGPAADVFLMKGRSSMVADVCVLNQDGVPQAGRNVHVVNSSGGNAGTTNSQGSVIISLGEPEVECITLDGTVVFDRRPLGLGQSYPSVADGLRIFIITK